MKPLYLALPCLIGSVAFAEPRSGDTLLSSSDLEKHLSGNVVEFFDGSKARYRADYAYGYTYTDDGPVWAGVWSTDDGSRVCIAFDNGSSRCDFIVVADGRTVLITDDGDRFPVRNISVDEE